MACWCDGKVGPQWVKIKPHELTGEWTQVEFCFKCGRDLRLPVARMYEWPDKPEPYDGKRFWFEGVVEDPKLYSHDTVIAIMREDGAEMFGPVTISPEVPE